MIGIGNNQLMKSNIPLNDDGKYQGVVGGAGLYRSADYGATFQQKVIDGIYYAQSIAISSTGQYFTIGAGFSGTKISSDYGVTFTSASGGYYFMDIAMSANGQYQSAVSEGPYGYIYRSTDYGATWSNNDDQADWRAITMSANGQYRTAVQYDGYIKISSDYGVTWATSEFYGNQLLTDVDMSASGQYQIITLHYDGGDQIYYSNSYGSSYSWSGIGPGRYWDCVSISSDHKYIIAGSDYIYKSSNYGSGLTPVLYAAGTWAGTAISSSGRVQTAVIYNGYNGAVYNSSDYGVTWALRPTQNRSWYNVAMNKLIE
jgi:photosystem II stability/assembly factor-like uncharacterized protein